MTVLTKVAVLLGLAASTVWGHPTYDSILPRQITPGTTPGATPGTNTTAACGAISQQAARQLQANPRAAPRFTAAQAGACLQSVPNKPAEAQELVRSVKAYVSWQSTLAYLKNPPASYGLPAVDIMGGLDAIAANASAGQFQSEYAFQESMVLLMAQAHDGHFGYRPDAFKAFTFRNDLLADIVSVSADGKQMPKLYNFAVLNGSTTTVGNVTLRPDANGLPPAISKINGQNATEFMVQQGLKFINAQDMDSQWNAHFLNYASPTARPVFTSSIFYQGNSVSVEYENGQLISQDSYALLRPGANFTGVNTGEDFYQRFCNPDNPSNIINQEAANPQPSTPPGPAVVPPNIQGFPTPAIRDSGANATAGYFLTGQGYEDVAVLSVLGFAPSGDFDTTEYVVNFQKVVGDFMAMSKQAGKTKLLIDVTGNGGGLVVAGFELYSQIFPGQQLFQANNLRRSPSLVEIADVSNANLDKLLQLDASALRANATREQMALLALAQSSIVSNLTPGGVFSAGNAVNFTSGAQITSPVPLAGDSFTAYQSTPLNSTSTEFNLTGTGNRATVAAAAFPPENVVILTDGTCGSTCTLFSYLAIMQNNVKTVSVGGRPVTGPMQSMGGVEGAQVFDLEDIQRAAAASIFLATPDQQAKMRQGDTGIIAEGYALVRAATPGSAGAVNGKNAFSHTDAQTPLQFLNQPANCKFFYTKDMILGPEATWKRAVDAGFNNPNQFCVDGSQAPLMGVQTPSQAFFTAQAEGGVGSSPQRAGSTSSSASVFSSARGLAGIFLTTLVSVAFIF